MIIKLWKMLLAVGLGLLVVLFIYETRPTSYYIIGFPILGAICLLLYVVVIKTSIFFLTLIVWLFLEEPFIKLYKRFRGGY